MTLNDNLLAEKALTRFAEEQQRKADEVQALADKYPTKEALAAKLMQVARSADTFIQTNKISFRPMPDDEVVKATNELPRWTLREDLKIAGQDDAPEHKLLIGDNIHALMGMFIAQKRFDVIYIDPPYNTGNKDFLYNDRFVDDEDSWSHTKYYSFLLPRLRLARELLTDDGVLVVSIGDREQHAVTSLLNSIFGENNRLGTVVRKTTSLGNVGTWFSSAHDYVIFYGVSQQTGKFEGVRSDASASAFNKEDDGGKYKLSGLWHSSLGSGKSLRYAIQCPDGTYALPPKGTFDNYEEGAEAVSSYDGVGCFRWSSVKFLSEVAGLPFKRVGGQWERGRVVWRKSTSSPLVTPTGNQSEWNISTKFYEETTKLHPPSTWWGEFLNASATRELKNIGVDFTYSKPVELIKQIIRVMGKPSDIKVLDFFAGSGTTGQAVIELNAEDEGTREFTLVTNNENNIALDVTLPRLTKVFTGQDWADGVERAAHPDSLVVYDVDTVKLFDDGYVEMVNEWELDLWDWVRESPDLFAYAYGATSLVERHEDGSMGYQTPDGEKLVLLTTYDASAPATRDAWRAKGFKIGVLAVLEDDGEHPIIGGDFSLPWQHAEMAVRGHRELTDCAAQWEGFYDSL